MSGDGIRLDKWLWQARFLKSRSLAAKLVKDGRVRVNSERAEKASKTVKVGDALTFPQADHMRVVKILALGVRRGPAVEAQGLYEDMSPPEAEPKPVSNGPRPTKKERRNLPPRGIAT